MIHFTFKETTVNIRVFLKQLMYSISIIAVKNAPENDREKILKNLVNATSVENDTPLHVAAQAGYIETVETLVDLGADVDVLTDTRSTPLHLAVIGGHYSTVMFLVRHDAKISASDKDQMTPLHRYSF